MQRKMYLPAAIIMLAAILFFISCRKILTETIEVETQSTSFTQREARTYFYKVLRKELIQSSLRNKKRDNKMYPYWQYAYQSKTDKYEFVEVPVITGKVTGHTLNLKSSGESFNKVSNLKILNGNLNRLILYKNKDGLIGRRIVTYIPDLEYLKKHNNDISENQIDKLDKDYNGYIRYASVEGELLFILRIENGVSVRKYSPKKQQKSGDTLNNTKMAAMGEEICETIHWIEWEQECTYSYPDGPGGPEEESCGEWYIVSEWDEIVSCYIDCSGAANFNTGECEEDPGGPDPLTFDCLGVLNGTAYMADCGCIGGVSGITDCTKDPCLEKKLITLMASRSDISAQNASILSQSTSIEYGADRKLTSLSANNYVSTTINPGIVNRFTPDFSWNGTDGYSVGASHGHPGNSAPSPEDAIWAYGNLTDPELVAGGSSDIQKYKERVSITTMTNNGTYIITIKDWGALQTLYSAYHANPTVGDANYVAAGQTYFTNNPFTATSETATEFALLSIYGSAINVYKAQPGTTTFDPLYINAVDVVAKKTCP